MAFQARSNGVSVDPRLVDILKQAARATGIKMSFTSGAAGRRSGTTNHPSGRAIDIQLYDANGKPLPNLADPRSFSVYERFAQAARQYQMQAYPELRNAFAWGGYFGPTQGNPSGFDLMHFDVSGNRGRMGSWETGLNDEGRRLMRQPASPGPTNVAMAQGTEVRNSAAAAPANVGGTSAINPAQRTYEFFIRNGLTPHEAAAITGNFAIESGDWKYINRFGDVDGKSYGLAQWRGDRLSNPQKTGLFDRFGRNPTLDQQLQFALDEYNSNYKNRMRLFGRGSQDLNALSDEWRRIFEGAVDTHQKQRDARALAVLQGNFGGATYLPSSGGQFAGAPTTPAAPTSLFADSNTPGGSFMGGLASALPGILGVVMEALKPPPAAPPPQAPVPMQSAVPNSNVAQLMSALIPGSNTNPYAIQ